MTWIDLGKRLTRSDSRLGRLRKHVESRREHLEGWHLKDSGSLDLAVRMKLVESTQIWGLFSKSGWHAELNLLLKEAWVGGESQMAPKLSIGKDGIVSCGWRHGAG